MYCIADWGRRKQEIASVFRQATPLPAESDPQFYSDILDKMNVSNMQDFAILYAVVEDAIMSARREERPSAPLEAFKDWLQVVRRG